MTDKPLPLRAFPNPLYHNSPGMNLRDYFAAAVLPQLIAMGPMGIQRDEEWFIRVSESAYKIADSMMKARDKE